MQGINRFRASVSGFAALGLFVLALLASPALHDDAQGQEADSTVTVTEGAMGSSDAVTKVKTSTTLSKASSDTTDAPWLGVTSDTRVDFTESYRQMESGLTWNYAALGWAYNSSINLSKKKLRGRDMDTIVESALASAARVSPGTYLLTIGIGDTYSRQRSVSLSQYGKDIVMETASAGLKFNWQRPLLMADGSDIGASVEASQGQQNFKYVRALKAEGGAHLRYRMGDRIKLTGGYGTHQKRSGADVGPIEFRGVRSHMDTLRTGLQIGAGDRRFLDLRYSRRMGKLRQVDPPFGNSMQVIDNPEEVREEENSVTADQLVLATKIRPMDNLSIDVDFSHSYSDEKFRVESRRNRETQMDDLAANISYGYRQGGSIGVTVERQSADYEYGPTSVASYRQKKYQVSASLRETIHDSLSVLLRGSMSLDQKFFKNREQNPRDADYTFASLYGKVDAYMMGFIKTFITGSMSRRETINIDASLSGDNRTDYQYKLIPEFSLNPTPWLSLGQKYEIKIDYTEFSFDPDQNYLNRNTTLVTDAGFRLFRRLRMSMEHRYNMKDTGSYLEREGGERKYGPTNENIENRLVVNMEYDPGEDLTIFIRSSFRGQENNTLGLLGGRRTVVNSSSTESGDLRVGFRKDSELPGGGIVDIDFAYVRKFGPFISEEMREYLDVAANVRFEF